VKAVRNTTQGIELVEVPEPAGGIRVHIRAVSICGSDLGLLAYGPLPFTLGHEIAGELDDGTKVAVEPATPCGTCDQCASGNTHRCRLGLLATTLGIGLDGGMSERIAVPERALVRLPPSIPIEDAAIVEPLAVAIHGLRIAGVGYGQRVAVVGGGSIGLTTVAAARDLGCEVGLVARHAHQQAAGERLGAVAVRGEYALTVEAAGTESAMRQACELAAPGGAVLVLGSHNAGLKLPGTMPMLKELRVYNAFGYNHHAGGRDFEAAAALLARQPGIARALITHRFPLADARKAFELAADRKQGAIKVVMHPG
jgi:threonine dehydrogenase-like Zn-dependent dehydrogenase